MNSRLTGAVWWVSLLVSLSVAFPAVAVAALVEVDRIVAVVNDQVVLASEHRSAMQDARRRLDEAEVRMPPTNALERRVLEQLIISSLQQQKAESLGIRIDDQQLNEALLKIARQNNLTLSEFRNVLESDGYSFAGFREKVRGEMVVSRLRQREVTNRVEVSDQEIDSLLAQLMATGGDDQEYHLAHLLIAVPSEATTEQVREAREEVEKLLARLRSGEESFEHAAMRQSDARNALEGGDLGWRASGQIPTLFADVVPGMKRGQVSDPIRSPAGFHLVRLVDVRGGERRVVTQTRARHILLRLEPGQSDEDLRIRLNQQRERLLSGESFERLARAQSQDRVSAARGGELGWMSPGETVPEFEQEMARLTPGEISFPFQSPYGWHIVQVLERRQHDSTDEYRRAQVREMISRRKGEEALDIWLRELRANAYVEYRLDGF